MDPDSIKCVIVVRDGPIPPTKHQALSVVMKFLPLVADDAPLIHVRRGTPGLMGDESLRDELALSLVGEMEDKGMLEPGAWERSRRMYVLAGDAADTDYLITAVLKAEPARKADSPRHPNWLTNLLRLRPRRP
jgi:hypothetical protein